MAGLTLEARVGILEHQMNGNGDIGVVQNVKAIYDYVVRKQGEEEGEANARRDALELAAANERKNAKSRSLMRWVAGGVLTVIFAIAGWSAVHLWDWLEPPISAAVQDYYNHHPEALPHGYVVKPKEIVPHRQTTGDTQNAHNQKPQFAGKDW
jgi:hypothetical protein